MLDANTSLADFKKFIHRTESLVQSTHLGPPINAFEDFLHKAKGIVIEPVRSTLQQMIPLLSQARPWLISQDLLRVVGLVYAEDAYTKLMAWSLHPETHPSSSLLRQIAWLEAILPHAKDKIHEAVVPQIQVVTDDGVPDLILPYEPFVVVVEAKTGTDEHPTPSSGSPQTISYPDAVRRKLELSSDVPVYMVFITPDGRQAANPEAANTTYARFCFALMSKLNPDQLPDELRFAFSMIFTHLLSCAVPRRLDVKSMIGKSDLLIQESDNETFLLSNLGDILAVSHLLFPRSIQ